MVGAYVGYFCMVHLKLGFVESPWIAMAACTVLGVVIERVAYTTSRKSIRTPLITAIGVSLLLEYTMMFFVGADTRTHGVLPPFMEQSFSLGGVLITMKQIIIIGVSRLMVVLQYVVRRTKVGKAMRAVSQTPTPPV